VINAQTQDEIDALERADRLIAEGVAGDRGLIASMVLEAVQHERERCAKLLDDKAGSLDEWAEKFQGTSECIRYQVRATDARDSAYEIRNYL
jgi:hypothetical protein